MARLIGFATEFYTLWDVQEECRYTTDSQGKSWLTGKDYKFFYIKNVSTDLNKVKSLYPDLSIDESLRGKCRDFIVEGKEDLCPQIMKFGKYYGRNLDELVSLDFNYVLWLVENGNYSGNRLYAEKLPQIVKHFTGIENEQVAKEAEAESILSELATLKTISFVAERNLTVGETEAYIMPLYKGIPVILKFKGGYNVMSYNGFDYALPTINGKAKRIKGNEITLTFEHIDSEFGDNEFLVHTIKINK